MVAVILREGKTPKGEGRRGAHRPSALTPTESARSGLTCPALPVLAMPAVSYTTPRDTICRDA